MKVRQTPCIDVYPKNAFKDAEQSLVFKAISLTESIWKPGTGKNPSENKITITFGGYNQCAGCSEDAAWSHIGSNSNSEYPSMNLGFIDPVYGSFTWKGKTFNVPESAARNYCKNGKDSCSSGWVPGATVVHEFCHALGMLHEHQNNLFDSNNIRLNEQNVKNYYRSIGMGDSGAYVNVIERYTCDDNNCEYSGTKFDPNSIMLYALPDDWVIGTNPTKPNFKLSDDDVGWLKTMYPKNIDNPPILNVEFVDINPEPWKVAWVEKIVKETFEPIIGIKWNFINSNSILKIKSITDNNTAAATLSPTISRSVTDDSKKIPVPAIIGIILGIVMLIVVVSLLIKYNYFA
jgi:hypothetical protein